MWLLWVFPPFIIVCGVGNLIIDAAVILIAAKCLKIDCFFKKNKTSILKAWGLGFAADFIGEHAGTDSGRGGWADHRHVSDRRGPWEKTARRCGPAPPWVL